MKAVLIALSVLIGIGGVLDIYALESFDYDTDGVIVEDYQLDHEIMSIILYVQVTEPIGTVEITFDRQFFDSVHQDQDYEFLIIENGDSLPYTETKTTPVSRTLNFFLDSGIEEVEIIGTHLQGQTIQKQILEENKINSETNENDKQIEQDLQQTNQADELENQIVQLREENQVLKNKNDELGNDVFELENLISTLEDKIDSLKNIVSEQINLITTWFNL